MRSNAAAQASELMCDAWLWEIAENLHRAEMTVQERADHIAEWVKLVEEKVRQLAALAEGVQPKDQGRLDGMGEASNSVARTGCARTCCSAHFHTLNRQNRQSRWSWATD